MTEAFWNLILNLGLLGVWSWDGLGSGTEKWAELGLAGAGLVFIFFWGGGGGVEALFWGLGSGSLGGLWAERVLTEQSLAEFP